MDATTALDVVVAALPGGGEARAGQRQMARAVEQAITTDEHLLVQAGTGTGKSIAYLVPAILSGRRVVVATATKALQDQLVGKDLPFLAAHLGSRLDRPFTFSALKGRSNYLCRQRADEVMGDHEQLALDGVAALAPRQELLTLVAWAGETGSGDRAELDFEPTSRAWSALSVSARECPGATRCPAGRDCFAEAARRRAAASDVVVVNTHLYGLHLASGSPVVPEHDILVVDEAHQLEEVISATAGMELNASRFTALARVTKSILSDTTIVTGVTDAGASLSAALRDWHGRRVRRPDGALAEALAVGRRRVERVLAGLRTVPSDVPADTAARTQRAQRLATALVDELDAVHHVPESSVAWVEGPEEFPTLRVAPIDVAPALAPLWSSVTVVLTSATMPVALGDRVGLDARTYRQLDVGSPFDYPANARLYCAAHLPDPRSSSYEPAMHAELAALIAAAGGRTLALFTSWRAMTSALDALRARLDLPLLGQADLPKPALLRTFSGDDATCLFATMGFWQGVNVVGPSLSLVTMDRLPFPRPDEPLLQARRERARAGAFATVDLPRATTLLAQGAGRLIRSATDRGVVAVLDPRLATARYRWDIIACLPPMTRTKDQAEILAYLRSLEGPATGPGTGAPEPIAESDRSAGRS